MIIKLRDAFNQSWYMALVGGFGVGSIILSQNIKIGVKLNIGAEIGHFDLGSTVCLATPYKIIIQNYLQTVSVGQNLEFENLNS